MKKTSKILCTGVLALASIGASMGLVGCTQEDVQQVREQALSTTNAIAVEYSEDMAKVLLLDAASRSVMAKNVTAEITQLEFTKGVVTKASVINTVEKIDDDYNTTKYFKNTYLKKEGVEKGTVTEEVLFTTINNKTYLFDLQDKEYCEDNNANELSILSEIIEQMMVGSPMFDAKGAKYVNNELEVVCNNVTVYINNEGLISKVFIFGFDGNSLDDTTTITISYDDVTFPVAIPTDFTGYTEVE